MKIGIRRMVRAGTLLVGIWSAGLLIFWGCSSNPTGPQSRSEREVRSDSDRFFDKMKQEERDHGKPDGVVR
jgi:hypothetical protein